jgi:hypothetical protein
MIIKRVGVWSVAKVSGVLYALLGFVIGIFISLISLMTSSLVSESASESNPFGALFGVGAVILLPLFYGFIGFISGAISTWLYNLIVGFIGGIEIEFADETPRPPQPIQQ